ncbi:uncharacterized protein [Littorina saxatilis]|uniref:uncharacterized protein n=1 Tax=Littorina saxatilis TaxID=31220 RepID=UPI0038B69902
MFLLIGFVVVCWIQLITVSAESLQQCNGVGTIEVRPGEPSNITCEITETTQNVTWTFLSLQDAQTDVVVNDCVLLSRNLLPSSCQSKVPYLTVHTLPNAYTSVEVVWSALPDDKKYGIIQCSLDGKAPNKCYLKMTDTTSTTTTTPPPTTTGKLTASSAVTTVFTTQTTTASTIERFGPKIESATTSTPTVTTAEAEGSTFVSTSTEGDRDATHASNALDEDGLSTAALIACVVVVVAVVTAVVVGVVVFCLWRRRKRRLEKTKTQQKQDDVVAEVHNAAYENINTLRSSSWRHKQGNSHSQTPSQDPSDINPTYIRDNGYEKAADLNSKDITAPSLDVNANGGLTDGAASDFDPNSRIYLNKTPEISQIPAKNLDEEECELHENAPRDSKKSTDHESTTDSVENGGSSERPEEQLRFNLSEPTLVSLGGVHFDNQDPFSHLEQGHTSRDYDSDDNLAPYPGDTSL